MPTIQVPVERFIAVSSKPFDSILQIEELNVTRLNVGEVTVSGDSLKLPKSNLDHTISSRGCQEVESRSARA